MPASRTSITALHSLDLGSILHKVLCAIETAGEVGLTCDEISEMTGIEYRTVTPRIVPLENAGLVYRAGDTRKGIKSNRQQQVIRAETHIVAVPMAPKRLKKSPFLEGMKFAARICLRNSDLTDAKRELKEELIKAACKL